MTRPPLGEGTPIERLVEVMARLRDPNGGCAWDLEQTFAGADVLLVAAAEIVRVDQVAAVAQQAICFERSGRDF